MSDSHLAIHNRPVRLRRRSVRLPPPPPSPPSPPPSPLEFPRFASPTPETPDSASAKEEPEMEHRSSRPRRASRTKKNYNEDTYYQVEYSDLDSEPEQPIILPVPYKSPTPKSVQLHPKRRRITRKFGSDPGAGPFGVASSLNTDLETPKKYPFHKDPHIPGIKLCDEETGTLVDSKYIPEQLTEVLRSNKSYAIYIGQTTQLLEAFLLTYMSERLAHQWLKEQEVRSSRRRIIMFSPRRRRFLTKSRCPTAETLAQTLDESGFILDSGDTFRVYNAEYTESRAFTENAWQVFISRQYIGNQERLAIGVGATVTEESTATTSEQDGEYSDEDTGEDGMDLGSDGDTSSSEESESELEDESEYMDEEEAVVIGDSSGEEQSAGEQLLSNPLFRDVMGTYEEGQRLGYSAPPERRENGNVLARFRPTRNTGEEDTDEEEDSEMSSLRASPVVAKREALELVSRFQLCKPTQTVESSSSLFELVLDVDAENDSGVRNKTSDAREEVQEVKMEHQQQQTTAAANIHIQPTAVEANNTEVLVTETNEKMEVVQVVTLDNLGKRVEAPITLEESRIEPRPQVVGTGNTVHTNMAENTENCATLEITNERAVAVEKVVPVAQKPNHMNVVTQRADVTANTNDEGVGRENITNGIEPSQLVEIPSRAEVVETSHSTLGVEAQQNTTRISDLVDKSSSVHMENMELGVSEPMVIDTPTAASPMQDITHAPHGPQEAQRKTGERAESDEARIPISMLTPTQIAIRSASIPGNLTALSSEPLHNPAALCSNEESRNAFNSTGHQLTSPRDSSLLGDSSLAKTIDISKSHSSNLLSAATTPETSTGKRKNLVLLNEAAKGKGQSITTNTSGAPQKPSKQAQPGIGNKININGYIWNYHTKTRSEILLPLDEIFRTIHDAREKCLYDGHDLNFSPSDMRISKDRHAFKSRKGTENPKRRVRVWSHINGTLVSFYNSPRLCELAEWLARHPNHSIFYPQRVLEPADTVHTDKPTEGDAVKQRLAKVVREQVLARINALGVTDLPVGAQEDVKLWNCKTRTPDAPRSFVARDSLTKFLLANPHLELPNGQAELYDAEKRHGLHLVPINENVPAEYAYFWDSAAKRRVSEGELGKLEGFTIKTWLQEKGNDCTIYLGQDIPHLFSIVMERLKVLKTAGKGNSYMFLSCPSLLQSTVFSKGWTPAYLNKAIDGTFNAVFWNLQKKILSMQPELGRCFSVEAYMRAHPEMALYVGQDLPLEVFLQLCKWFGALEALKGEPVRLCRALTKVAFVPRPHPLRLNLSHEPEDEMNRRRSKKRPAPLQGSPESSPKRLTLRLKGNADIPPVAPSPPSAPPPPPPCEEPACEQPESEDGEPKNSSNTTKCSDEYVDGSKDVFVLSPANSVLDEGGIYQPRRYDEQVSPEDAHPLVAEVEDGLVVATRSIQRTVALIKEVAMRVLHRELKHDLRQTLREQLLLEIESVKHFSAVVKAFGKMEFLDLAAELAPMLKSLDVHDCFSNGDEFGWGPVDLVKMIEDVDTGTVFTITGVVQSFREICADLLQFHSGTLLHNEAVLLKFHGEAAITRFENEHRDVVQLEQKFLRMSAICERAKQIGFIAVSTRRRSRNSSHKKSGLRLPQKSEVTFLNYRDEKGNSVMGKRHSVRVFGFTIDRRKREAEAGGIRPCHICQEEVAHSSGDSLRCSNHTFDHCKELVCRQCLATVFSVEKDEFKILRAADKWFCVHCLGVCPGGSNCRSTCEPSDEGSKENEQRYVRFEWPIGGLHVRQGRMCLVKRQQNGRFAPMERGKWINLSLNNAALYVELQLGVGAYRCMVVVDGLHLGSSTFQVWPVKKLTQEEGKRTNVVYHGQNGEDKRTMPRGPRVHWSQSLSNKDMSRSHAIRSDGKEDGGSLIEQSSRTEGYDWRRAKRRPKLQWVPRYVGPEKTREEGGMEKVVLCATDTKRAHLTAADNPPRLRVGISGKEFVSEIQTFKYEKMVKNSWGIVTGRSEIHGIGLFTMTGYQKSDYVIEYAGALIRNILADIREKTYDDAGLGTYFFRLNDKEIVDATVVSNRARFTNHSCDPNMVAEIIHVHGRDLVVLKATREIAREAELTFDYQLPIEDNKVVCLCNAWNCAGVMN